MKLSKRFRLNYRGVSLVEIIVVTAAVIALSLLIINIPKSMSLITRSQHTSVAKDVATKKLNALRSQPYASLSNGVNSFNDSQLAPLSGVNAYYEVEDCPLSVCPNGGNIKKVTVSVSWSESGEVKKVELETLIYENGIGK